MTCRWGKIFALGQKETYGIFDDRVSITEKVDGSQFNFGIDTKYGLQMLSKSAEVQLGNNNLFDAGASVVMALAEKGKLNTGWSYHSEVLWRPKHNTLVYDRVPLNNLALYGVTREDGSTIADHKDLTEIANDFRIDVVPELYKGLINPYTALEMLSEFLGRTSYLGGPKIEGVVVKNHSKTVFVGGKVFIMQGKYVREDFKEQNDKAWKDNKKPPIQIVGDMVRTQARWDKAYIHAREQGIDVDRVQAIGPLIKLLKDDVRTEDQEMIKNFLWSIYKDDIERVAIRGFPEYFKQRLVNPGLTLAEFDKKSNWVVDNQQVCTATRDENSVS